MRSWHRIVALVVALIFAPGSVLAAMPIVWCVGGDGHRAIEYHISADGRHIEHAQLGKQTLSSAMAEPSEADDCQDWHLVGKTSVAGQQPDHGVLTFDLRIATIRLTTHVPTLPEIAQAARFLQRERLPPDPQRVELHSVVLLI